MKYSKEIVEEICKYINAGNNYKDSANLAGVSESTFYDWQRELESDGKPNPSYHVELVEALKKAENTCKARNIAFIQKAAQTTWQAAAWWLERKYHNEFALKTVMEHISDEDKPLIIKIVSEKKIDEPTGTTHKELSKTTVNL